MIPYRIDVPYGRAPIVTAGLIAANILFFIVQWKLDDATISALLTQPADFQPWQWLTSAFMHADVFHLGGNMLFLWVYGRYVEERLGPWRYLLIYLTLAFIADMAFVLTSTDGVPALGASGAISGVMGVVIMAAPKANVRVLWIWYMMVHTFKLPAFIILGIWALEQMWMATYPDTGIAISAHLGGFFAGVIVALLLRTPSLQRTGWWLGIRENDEMTDEERWNRTKLNAYAEAARLRHSQRSNSHATEKPRQIKRGLYERFGE